MSDQPSAHLGQRGGCGGMGCLRYKKYIMHKAVYFELSATWRTWMLCSFCKIVNLLPCVFIRWGVGLGDRVRM